jgi:N-acetylmuramoyl-L-alanine amidase
MKLLAACLALVPLVARADVGVAFPAERQRLAAVDRTYVIGAVDAGETMVYVNGVTTAVHRTGAFIQMVPVTPGDNVLTVACGGSRLVRRFFVAKAEEGAASPPPEIADDDSEHLEAAGAWRTTGSLFANRVRAGIGDGDSIFYLPRGFTLRAAPVKGTGWAAVWLEGRRGYLQRSRLEPVPGVPPPPKGLIAPDPAAGFSDRPPYGRPPSSVRICVDAGHGGADSGAVAPHGWKEKEVNLMQARAIRDALERAGFQVLMTRDGDSSPSLLARPQIAYDERVDAFISVHHNATAASRDPRAVRHTTTYASTSNGLALARCIQKHVADVMAPVPDAGAQMRSYAVCRNPAVPSCLIEVDFINLPEGEEESWNPARQKKVADAVVLGVLDWMTPPPPRPLVIKRPPRQSQSR